MDSAKDPGERRGMDLHLSPELSDFVEEQVRRGEFGSADELVREAVRRLAEDRRAREEVREQIDVGLAELRAGLGIDGDVVAARMRARIAEHRKNGL